MKGKSIKLRSFPSIRYMLLWKSKNPTSSQPYLCEFLVYIMTWSRRNDKQSIYSLTRQLRWEREWPNPLIPILIQTGYSIVRSGKYQFAWAMHNILLFNEQDRDEKLYWKESFTILSKPVQGKLSRLQCSWRDEFSTFNLNLLLTTSCVEAVVLSSLAFCNLQYF